VEVTFTSFEKSTELTAAFHRPQLLQNGGFFTLHFEHVLSHSPIKKAVVIDYETDRASVAWLLCFTLIISVMTGVAFGFGVRRAELGIGISAGLFTMLSIIEMLVIWLCTS